MPADPRTSGFFDPIQRTYSGTPVVPLMDGSSESPLQLQGGYRNVYGTQVGVTYDPQSQQTGLNTRIPIGDHQRQLFFGLNAQGNPQTRDWGATLSLTKKIAPRTPTAGEAINAITGGALNRPVPGASGVVQADLRSNFMNSLSPEQLQMLGQDVKQYQREAVDQALGIRPGAEKYSFELGFKQPRSETQQQEYPMLSGLKELLMEEESQQKQQGKDQLDQFINQRGLIQ